MSKRKLSQEEYKREYLFTADDFAREERGRLQAENAALRQQVETLREKAGAASLMIRTERPDKALDILTDMIHSSSAALRDTEPKETTDE